jgi:hypothetical protein
MRRGTRILFLLLVAVAVPGDSSAQAAPDADSVRIEKILKFRDDLEKESRTFRLGLSVGWRHRLKTTGDIYRDVVIDPTTNFVQVDEIDRGDVVLSGIMTAYPFQVGTRAGPLGFVANVNIASFDAENIGAFNRTIEGGGGIAWRLNPDFGLGFTMERVFSRRLRSFVKPGAPLVVAGDTLTSLSPDDGRFFRDDNMTAVSLKFLYFLR